MKLNQICKNRSIRSNYIKTPILVPSFSSKGFKNIENLHKDLSKYIIDSKLISAYDLYYENISSNELYDSEILFLDSGGYESKNFINMSNLLITEYKTFGWSKERYKNIIRDIKPISDIVIVNYDFEDNETERQIILAKRFFSKCKNFYKDFLIKPERNSDVINVDKYIDNIRKLREFDILGFTEKELGRSIKERLRNLLKIRTALLKMNIDKPIHIFGCLDPLSVWLYFLFGADIFDGLTWLRYAYSDTGEAIYSSNNNLLMYPDYDFSEANLMMYYNNIKYLQRLNTKMNIFSKSYNFDDIEIKESYKIVIQNLLKEFMLI